jgi:predicted SAM-dependent methyltransferase
LNKCPDKDADKIVIDLGCKKDKVSGAIGVDIDPDSHADILHDLSRLPYPFPENHADLVYAKHIIEHLSDPVLFLKEVHRILKPGGRVLIETPHFSNYVAYAEPQHKHYYSYFMFRNLLASAAMPYKIITWKLTFYKTFRFFGIAALANKWPENYERFWTYLFPAECIQLELEKTKVQAG